MPTQVAQQARSSIWPLSRVLRPLHLPPKTPSGSTFRPDQVASRLRKQRARREGMSRKVVRSFSFALSVLFMVLLYGYGVLRIRDIFVPANHHIGQAFESWKGSSPLARFPPAWPGEPIPSGHQNPSPKQACSTSPQKGSPVNPRNRGREEGGLSPLLRCTFPFSGVARRHPSLAPGGRCPGTKVDLEG